MRVAHPDPGLRIVFAPTAPVPSGWYQLELAVSARRPGRCRGPVRVRKRPGAVAAAAADRAQSFSRAPAPRRWTGQLTLIVNGSGRLSEPMLCRFERVGWGGQLAAAARRGRDIFRRDGFGVLASGLNYLWRRARGSTIAISRGSAAVPGEPPYQTWMRIFDEHPERDRARHEARLASLTQRPLISLLSVLPAAEEAWLVFLARSLSGQIYPDWEFIVAAPAGLHDKISSTLGRQRDRPGQAARGEQLGYRGRRSQHGVGGLAGRRSCCRSAVCCGPTLCSNSQ